MKKFSLMLMATLASLTGCGGGGSESGRPDVIEVTPQLVNATGTANHCVTGAGPSVYIHGGHPPYQLFNTLPSAMQLSSEIIQRSGDSFVVTFTGQCFDNLPIKIEDALGQLGEVMLTNRASTPTNTTQTPAQAAQIATTDEDF